ncbi:MAG: SH3 domain-containing protein [Clostridium sp.]|nr:SH3 domain-containing protein [Clostridium sp.]
MTMTLKTRFLALWLALFAAVLAYAEAYQPNSQVKSYITVRAQAKSGAKEIGRIQKAEIFEVTEITGGWGKVKLESGKTGYVNAKFIEKVPAVKVNAGKPAKAMTWKGGTADLHWMVWLILALMAGVFIMQKLDLEGDVSVWVTPIMWFLLGSCQLIYLICCKDPFWTNENLGWLAILLAVVVFAIGAFYQTGSMIGFAKIYSEDNAWVGIWSVPVCVVGGIILNYTAPAYVPWAFAVFGLSQLWQAFVIFRTVNQYQGAGLATVSAIGYLFGMLGTVVMAALLVALVIFVMICLFVLWLVLSVIGSESKQVKLTHNWGSFFTDQYGNEWEHIGGNTFRRT